MRSEVGILQESGYLSLPGRLYRDASGAYDTVWAARPRPNRLENPFQGQAFCPCSPRVYHGP
jgi:hypothetical protein